MNKDFFDQINDRHGSDSYRYDVPSSFLPLTVADTDFPTSPFVVEAIKRRLEHPLFGYTKMEDSWKKECASFYKRRFGLELDQSMVGFSTGVLAVIDAFLLRFTSTGDGVIVTGPVYNCFYSCIEHTGRKVIDIPIVEDHLDLDAIFKAMDTHKRMILCSPHNPLGIGFKKEELDALFQLAQSKGGLILSDEIHGPVCLDKPYVPSLSLSSAQSVVIMASSPSKAFNTAGIHAAFFAAKDEKLFEAMQEQIYSDDCGEPSCFAQGVLEACYKNGDDYLDALNGYLKDNLAYLADRLEEDGRVKAKRISYTYLAWLDVRSLTEEEEELIPFLEKRGLGLVPGKHYGEYGKGFLRLNFATPRKNLIEALNRLFLALDDYQKACNS